MKDGISIKIEGAQGLHDALGEFKKTTERGLLRRIAVNALQPVIEEAKRMAPVDDGYLRDSLRVGGQLTKRAKQAARADPVDGVRVFAGTANRNGVPREFGSVRTPPHPFLRPAWEHGKGGVLTKVMDGLAAEIEKTKARAARRGGKG